ncbi:2-amino-4-hydroxy-6-hydroxymethyldihydropteridine diphosphokinase [Weissella viridescens]|uniref:2-amino-4-hydroxy-6- hydroxymethyldihydropteridine diphosphokinase n=1 Tax=Weissella viridescens TaxID=1629 RepID=UPI001FD61264|nr:2-amino-4-hydroxy-6-hydroxymethyldihydropteridine diphosphokinase [Weissella viridescens]
MENIAYIGLGSNMGDSQATLRQVIADLDANPNIQVLARSPLYQTDPVGNVDQDQFVNAVIKIGTTLTPEALLDVLHELEQKYHRVRTVHWGPRTLDLDIELYNDVTLQTQSLDIPHREMFNRLFVLVPLLDVLNPTHPRYQQVTQAAIDLAGQQYIAKIEATS